MFLIGNHDKTVKTFKTFRLLVVEYSFIMVANYDKTVKTLRVQFGGGVTCSSLSSALPKSLRRAWRCD